MPVCWKARVVLPKCDAQALSDALAELDPAPAVSAFELGERALWEVEAFFTEPPSEEDLLKRFGHPMRVMPIEDENWVARALEGLPPVTTQRFFIYGGHSAARVPQNAIALRIEASTAFGTGHHGTTKGCLLAFEELAKRRTFRNALDLGCGTGVLAMAFAHLARRPVVATDIDPLAAQKTIENARLNHARVRATTADGFKTRLIADRAPYDIIFANILAGPLLKLLPGIKQNLARGGHAVLSGLLDEQTNAVLAMARAQNLRLVKRSALDGWVTLILVR